MLENPRQNNNKILPLNTLFSISIEGQMKSEIIKELDAAFSNAFLKNSSSFLELDNEYKL